MLSSRLFLAGTVWCLVVAPLSAAPVVTVSPEGPLRTLEAGRDAVRMARKAGDVGPATILVQPGRYEQVAPLELGPEDSELTIGAAGPAKPKPHFVGGTVITGFKPHEGKIVKADASKVLKKGVAYRQVLVNEERAILARYPNFDAADPLYGGWAFIDALPEGASEAHQWKLEGYIKPQDLRTWAHPEDVELDIFPQYGWWNFVMPVKALDHKTRKLTLAKPCGYDLHPHNRYHFQNALEELDAPGEWYLDPRTLTLYLWPTVPIEQAEVRVVSLESFIKVQPGTKKVSVERLSFTGCQGAALSFANTEDCRVAGCTLKTVGGLRGVGISISGGSRNLALSNDISYTGSNGISVGGGDRKTLTHCDNAALNNHIHHVGVFDKNACGVGSNGVGIRIAHNLIHDGPRMGVQMGGNFITVEYNHFHHLVMETQDGGAIYTGGRDWISSRGSKWNYNRIHDIVGVGQEAGGLKHPWFTFGLYPDDNTGGVEIVGNLVYRIAYTPIHLHNSRDCLVENNVFAFGEKFQFDLHGWKPTDRFFQSHQATMIAGYESVIANPAWKAMPNMELHPRDAVRDDGTIMSGDIVRRNIMVSGKPGVQYGDLRNVTPKWNTIDYNLAWNGGHPISTGIIKVGESKGEPLASENFDAMEAGKLPKGWGFNHRPSKEVKFAAEGGALRIEAALSSDPKNPRTVIHGADFPLKAGQAYRVKLWMRSSEPTAKLSMAIGSYVAGKGYWQSQAQSFAATAEWQELEVVGRVPKENEAAWKPWIQSGWLRMDLLEEKGSVYVDDVRIYEAAPLSEWESWQAEGWDQHSIVADPLFVDVAKDDFRLRPESPAIKQLGFQPLPIEKMGLYRDEWRSALPAAVPAR